jgi:prepilin-type N-terminal cleavage/methylation domain-containing protein
VTRPSADQAGFTLIEVMVALLLAAIAIMGILGLYTTSTRASGFSRHTTEATILAEDKIESLRLLPAVQVGTAITEPGLGALGTTSTGIFTRSYTSLLVPNPACNYANVQVIVTWNDDGTDHSVKVNSKRNCP